MAKKSQDVRPIIKLRSTAGTGYMIDARGIESVVRDLQKKGVKL